MLKALIRIAIANFAAFLVIDTVIGGDALSGRIANGVYFLGNHGHFTPVSHALYLYSAIHAYSALGGLVAAFLAAAIVKARRTAQGPRSNCASKAKCGSGCGC
ncbi:hypothetical protein MTR62_15850 [Novosphingobium sp. 1949]|uniref:Uncharacterized protein n=1 Tax=Novosphingobium organovorum TaxID=2930092 RepID=A0ABT0BGI2_9SPHN|nr:hypothetical protein [Novosphingobium organovorum]MCJ2184153.1 hypothetical protein [Novosphingobium organovorum]